MSASDDPALFPEEPVYAANEAIAVPKAVENREEAKRQIEQAIAASQQPLSETETKVLAAMRSCLSPEELADPFVTENSLLRYMRARKLDKDAAVSMLRATLAWRKEHHLGDILRFPPVHSLQRLRRIIAEAFHGFDRLGRPLIITNYGGISATAMALRLNSFDFVRAQLWIMEKWSEVAQRQSEALGRTVNFCTVIDLEGLGLAHRHFLAYFNMLTAILERNYPETLGLTLLVNAPPIFAYFWKIIRPWLDDYTASKIQILSKESLNALSEYIDPQFLPKYLGGTCECPGGCLPEIPQSVEQEDAALRERAAREFKLQTVTVRPGKIHTLEFRIEREDVDAAKAANGRVQLEYYFSSDRDIRFHVDFLAFEDDPLEALVEAELKSGVPSAVPSVDGAPLAPRSPSEDIHEAGRQGDSEFLSALRARRGAILERLNNGLDKASKAKRNEKMKKFLPLHTYQSHLVPIAGTVYSYAPGTFCFHFDNYNSYLSSKSVTFGVRIVPNDSEDMGAAVFSHYHAEFRWPYGVPAASHT